MARLTEQGFWEQTYASGRYDDFNDTVGDRRTWRTWADRVFWDQILPRWIEGRQGQRLVEVGAAPGRHLLQLKQRFGIDPWGIEYTDAGTAAARARLERVAVDPDQIVQADVFSDEVLERFGGFFDVALSMGFIEHFDAPERAVRRHLELVKPGGLVVITVPVYRGLSLALLRWMRAELVPLHNLDVMTPEALRATVDPALGQVVLAERYGVMNLGGYTATTPFKRNALRGLRAIQRVADVALVAGAGQVAPNLDGVAPYAVLVARRRP